MKNMSSFKKNVNGKSYEMFYEDSQECYPSWFSEKKVDVEPEIFEIMQVLNYISDTYSTACYARANKTKCYQRWKDDYLSKKDPYIMRYTVLNKVKPQNPMEYLGPVGPRICSFKAIITAFIYVYFKEMKVNWKGWFSTPYSSLMSEYANNLYWLLRYSFLSIEANFFITLPTSPSASCIGYVLNYRNGNTLGFQHAFLMILEGDYFIIYDAWAGEREKWIRAMHKDNVKEILEGINSNLSFDERRNYFAYFFSGESNIDFTDTHNFNDDYRIFFLELESEIFKKAYKDSKKELMFAGKSKSRVIRKNKRRLISKNRRPYTFKSKSFTQKLANITR